MASLPSLRASDADRENVAERLRHATAEGRLSGDELEERLEALYTSRTYGELDALVADLPVTHSPRRPRVRVARWVGAVAALALVLAALGMLAIPRAHTAAFVGPHFRQFTIRPPVADPQQALIATASTAGVIAVVLACVAVIWVLMRSRSASDS